jgi:hypothetical protein
MNFHRQRGLLSSLGVGKKPVNEDQMPIHVEETFCQLNFFKDLLDLQYVFELPVSGFSLFVELNVFVINFVKSFDDYMGSFFIFLHFFMVLDFLFAIF